MEGPSRCPLCKLHEETMDHIMLGCPFAKEVWIQILNLDLATHLPHSVHELFSNWNSLSPFNLTKKAQLNSAWGWLPKATSWKIWLERNNRIFRNQESSPNRIAAQARATLGEVLESNSSIKNSIQLQQNEIKWLTMLTSRIHPGSSRKAPETEQWEVRLEDTEFRRWRSSLNEPSLFFDGASKGNPGLAGAGGLISSADGITINRFAWGLGIESNNVAEFCGLWQGLKIARSKGMNQILVFGDSRILIKALIMKKAPHQIKLSHIYHKILHLSRYFQNIRYFHVHRVLNDQADKQANKGVSLAQGILCTDGDFQRCDIP